MTKYSSITLFLFTFLFISNINATTIAPFENLGEMARNTNYVVKAKVIKQYDIDINNTIKPMSELEVIINIKGGLQVKETFIIRNYQAKVGEYTKGVWGDLELNLGQTYVLFLHHMYDNVYQPTMLSYGALEEVQKNGEDYLLPIGLGLENQFLVPSGQDAPEQLGAYRSTALVSHLQSITKYEEAWNAHKVLSRYKVNEFDNVRMFPAHCTTLFSGTPYVRWEDIEATALPLYEDEAGDASCGNETTQLTNAVADINNSYVGLSISIDGTHDFAPTCPGSQGATDGEFTSYINTNYGSSRNHLVIYDDPCNEIPALSGCNGTLAFGGSYASSATYTYNGNTYRKQSYGYVVVNDGTGACQCGNSDYSVMMTHEITHGLNFGHIEAANGAANMNPFCCNGISTLDEDCVDFIYEQVALPVSLTHFEAINMVDYVNLEWNVEMEINNDYYTLERKSSLGKYEVIATLGSNRNLAYAYTDYSPQPGLNYYRLSQTDYDGTSIDLGTRTVEFSAAFSFNIAPNPILNGIVKANLNTTNDDPVLIKIYNSNGATITTITKAIQAGGNKIDIDMDNYPTGMYIIQVQQGQQSTTTKFLHM